MVRGFGGALALLGFMLGCTADQGPPGDAKSQQIPVAQLLAEHAGQRVCFGFKAQDNSCASIMEWTLREDVVYLRETSVFRDPATRRPYSTTLTSRAVIKGERLCLNAQDMELVHDTFAQVSLGFIFGALRSMDEAGGEFCAKYYKVNQRFTAVLMGAQWERFGAKRMEFQLFDGVRDIRPH
jgi:hypothetical protein